MVIKPIFTLLILQKFFALSFTNFKALEPLKISNEIAQGLSLNLRVNN